MPAESVKPPTVRLGPPGSGTGSLTYTEVRRADDQFGIAVPPKCASSSITNTLPKAGVFSATVNEDRFLALQKKYLFMREPYGRLCSAYRMEAFYPGFEKRYGYRSYASTMLKWIEDRKEHQILLPQVTWIRGCMDDVQVIRWDFSELAALLGVHEVETYNKSEHIYVPTTTQVQIVADRIYKGDIDLWRRKRNGR